MRELECPKCGGKDYFMSKRTIMKGLGGIYGNRAGVKAFPVCRVCDEIMATPPPEPNKFDRMSPLKKILVIVAIFVGFQLVLAFINIILIGF
jgi:hypothetical protein